MELKKSEEDYLRIIFHLDENKGVRNSDIAQELGISKASVSEMLRKLANKKLVKIKPYSRVFLTELGEEFASSLFKKHRVSKILMKKLFNCTDETAESEAHNLEHSFSIESIEKIEKIIEGKPVILPRYVG